MDCGLRGSTQHLGLEIPVGMGRRCCDGPSYEYCGQTEIWDRYEAGQTFTEIAASVGGVCCSGCFEVLEGGGGVDGVPGDYGVGEEGGATRLVRP